MKPSETGLFLFFNAKLASSREISPSSELLRSRARWIGEGEKITKHCCTLEKRNYVSKRMIKITFNNGQIISESDVIIEEVSIFFNQNLHTERTVKYCEMSDMVDNQKNLVKTKTTKTGVQLHCSMLYTRLDRRALQPV